MIKNEIQYFVKKTTFSLTIIIILSVFFIFSLLYPFCSDDYTYRFIFSTTEPIKNLPDVFFSQIEHYFKCNGRFVAHCLVQSFLMLERTWFSLANTICYALCCACLAKLISKNNFIYSWAFILLTLWIIMPSPGATCFWLTGSFNYLWSICATSVFLLLLFSEKKKHQIYALPIGIISGSWHEAVALSTVAALIMYCIISEKKSKFFYIAICAYMIGFFSLLVAPGNYVRLGAICTPNPADNNLVALLWKYFRNFLKIGYRMTFNWSDLSIQICTCMWCITSVICYKLLRNRDKAYMLPASLLIGGIFSVSLNIVSGVSGARSLFGFCFMSYIATIILLNHIKSFFLPRKKLIIISAIFVNAIVIPYAYGKIQLHRDVINRIEQACIQGQYICSYPPCWNNDTANISRYAGNYLSPCTLSNWHIRDFFQIEDFSILSHNDYETVIQNKSKLYKLKEHESFNLGSDFHIARLHTRPNYIRASIKASPNSLTDKSMLKKALIWIESQKQQLNQCYIIRINDVYFACWHQSIDMDAHIKISYDGKSEVNINTQQHQANIAINIR